MEPSRLSSVSLRFRQALWHLRAVFRHGFCWVRLDVNNFAYPCRNYRQAQLWQGKVVTYRVAATGDTPARAQIQLGIHFTVSCTSVLSNVGQF